jgi:hypothetical protein
MNKEEIIATVLAALNDRMSRMEENKKRAAENIQDDPDFWNESLNYWSQQVEGCKEAKKFIFDLP